ncbi:amidohydrolase family protein [Leifsonia shinshuensis]|uniref:amidohydrolase n=1 Tax=Leifsonia shinshuensis TaxID=150026 RepID=UPI0027E34CED|nr:amidohydrolase family protein [Leifsonia shinshuensis]MCI0157606.1 amidohydrolase family protein [Leifsonia shinshuensis]
MHVTPTGAGPANATPTGATRTGARADAPADLVLRGGVVHTLDAAETTGEAVAIRAGRILRVGTSTDVEATIGRRTRVIDLDGRAVLPGINDSHLHAAWLGAMWPRTVFGGDASGAPDSDAPSAGYSGDHGALDDRAAGSGAGSGAAPVSDPHDASASAPQLSTREERRSAILRAGRLIASLGITSYTEPGLGPGEDGGATGCFGQDVADAYVELETEGALTARVTVLALFGVLDGPSSLSGVLDGLRTLSHETERPQRLRVAGVKVFADGIPPMQQAWTRHRYPDGGQGGLLVEGADATERLEGLRAMIREANRLGLQIGVHATGDRTIDAVVEAVAAALEEVPTGLRHYIIHGDLVTPAALARMAGLGMGLNVQSGIAVRTAPWLAGVLGDDVAAAAWPLAAARAAGVPVSLSSDAPILPPDWRQGIADADAWLGAPAPGEERARMRELLHAYTTVPARQDGAESWKGTLEPGKAADLVVLGADPLRLAPAELPAVSIDLTVVDGAVVYERTAS